MKKALAVLLSVLVMFSMLGVVAFAQEEAPEGADKLIFVKFCNENGDVIRLANYSAGAILGEDDIPDNPTKAPTETEEYIFKGWRCSADGNLYHKGTPYAMSSKGQPGDFFTFTAEFSVKVVGNIITVWNLIESIFERINLIFQYFAKIFEW